MSMNFNDAEPQQDFSPLPDGTMVWLGLDLHFGGFGDDRSLTNSKEGDTRHLNMELTVLYGRYAKRKVFERWTVEAQNPTEGQAKSIAITRSRIRAMLNSARGIPPKDDSENARAGRTIKAYGELHKMCFAAELGIRKGNDGYPPRNVIKKIIEPDHELYGPIRTGTYVDQVQAPAAPAWGGQTTAAPGGWGAPQAQQPAWGGGQQPVQPQQQWAAPSAPQQQWNAPPAAPQQQWGGQPQGVPQGAPWDPNAGSSSYVAPTAPTGPAPNGWGGNQQAAPEGQQGAGVVPDWVTMSDNKPA